MKALIVDNQELVFTSLERTLKKQGYEIVIARNVYTAVETLKYFEPDILITDSNIPTHKDDLNRVYGYNEKTEGLNLIYYLRMIKHDFVPIILLSANYDEAIVARGFALGVNDYVQKPLNLNEISVRIKKLTSEAYNMEKNNSMISVA